MEKVLIILTTPKLERDIQWKVNNVRPVIFY